MVVAGAAGRMGRAAVRTISRRDDMLLVGNLRIRALHTPGHTADSMCLVAGDRVFTGDTLLIGGTGRTDLPTGDPQALYESLFEKLLALPPETLVFPAHDYKGRSHSTIGDELASNPRLTARSLSCTTIDSGVPGVCQRLLARPSRPIVRKSSS